MSADMMAESLPTPIDSTDLWDDASCRPGSGSGTLARLGRVLLLVGSTDPAAVAPLLGQAELVAANGGQGRQLVRSFALLLGTATTDPPDFVALAPHPTGIAILVQGDASVTVNGETISGRDSLAWVEKLVPFPITSLSATVDASSVERPHLRLGDGVVEAGSFSLGARTATEAGMDGPVKVVDIRPVEPAPEAVIVPPPPPPAPVVETPPAPPAPPVVEEPVATEPLPHQAPPPALDKPVEAVAPPVVPDPAPPVVEPVAPPPYEAGGFDAVRLDDMADDFDAPAPLPIVDQPSDVEDHDHVEQVRGVYCKNRHFNDPRLLFCGVCGSNMAQLTPVLVNGSRPPLGVIVLDDGAVFQLDTAYLLGRDPASDERVRAGDLRAFPLVDTSNQIGRAHARLELREWDVVLVDNSSVNGTFVNAPNAEGWYRLPSGGEHVLTQGTRVRIGHRTMAYNAHGH